MARYNAINEITLPRVGLGIFGNGLDGWNKIFHPENIVQRLKRKRDSYYGLLVAITQAYSSYSFDVCLHDWKQKNQKDGQRKH